MESKAQMHAAANVARDDQCITYPRRQHSESHPTAPYVVLLRWPAVSLHLVNKVRLAILVLYESSKGEFNTVHTPGSTWVPSRVYM